MIKRTGSAINSWLA